MSHIKILCTGDLHLGRVSSKCVQDGEELAMHSVRKAWERIVDYAVTTGVQILLLSGDIADDGTNQYEAMGPFEAGIRRLAARGIQVFMVAGNHDARVLPKLSGLFTDSSLRLLGRDGWEQVAWPAENPAVTIAGWSFTSSSVDRLPVEDFTPVRHDGTPLIAVTHADYRSTAGGYASVRVSDLLAKTGVDLWLLGHIHMPEKIDGTPIILNPGSPQALDPGEPQVHGPWLIEIDGGRITRVEQAPLSTVLYCRIEVNVTDMTEEDELVSFLLRALEPVKGSLPEGYAPRIACRAVLRGRTSLLTRIQDDCRKIESEQPLLETHRTYLERIDTTELAPAYDLGELRRLPGMIGVLAGLLHGLESGELTDEHRRFFKGAEDAVLRVTTSPAYPEDVPKDGLPTPAAVLTAECRRMLDVLLRQQEEMGA